MRALASIGIIALLGACGRIDFAPRDDAERGDGGRMDAATVDAGTIDAARMDAPSSDAPSSDAPSSDAPSADAPTVDAPTVDATAVADGGQAAYCNELTGATEAECAAAIASFVGTPRIFYACALACRLGRCFALDAADCPGCACEAYVQSSQICDADGSCGPPLSGSGCVGGGYYAGPPIRCASGGTLEQEGGCILQYLVSAGNCD